MAGEEKGERAVSYQTWIDERCKEALRHLNDPDAPVTLKRLSWNTLLYRKKGLKPMQIVDTKPCDVDVS